MVAGEMDAMTGRHEARVNRCMDYVREHLDADLSLPRLAEVAGCSPYHFHRVFKALTGETLTTFVQRARLERAAYLMIAAPDRKLDAIALDAGFESHSNFSRVFKRHYGRPPSDWDRKTRLDAVAITSGYETALKRAMADADAVELRVVDQPCRHLVYARARTPFLGPPLVEAYERLIRGLERRGIDTRRADLVGWSWDNHETTPLDRVCFDFGLTVAPGVYRALGADRTLAEDGLGRQHFGAHRAVQARATGPHLQIAVAWEVLYTRWLPRSGHNLLDMPATKVFAQRPEETGWEHFDLWCSLALESA